MADLIALWHAEHARFARLLEVLEEQLAQFENDGNPLYGLMLDIVSYLKEQSDRFHHPREDAAFECMVRHDPTLRLPVNRLLQEHRAIAVAGDELTTHLNEVIVENVVERATLESAVALYLSYYRHHLATEENEILPRAASLMTAQDWASVGRAVAPGADPLFGATPEERYRELREFLDAREHALRANPGADKAG